MASNRIFLPLLCVLALASPAMAAGRHTKGEKPLSIAQGRKVELADFLVTGKVTIFDFTSEYCPVCRAFSEPLLALHRQRRDIAVVKVDINRPEYHLIDYDSPVARQFALIEKGGVPHFKIYGPDGKLYLEGQEARLQVNQWLAALE